MLWLVHIALSAFAAESPPGLVSTEFIFETAAFPACHASTVAETSQGLVCAWFGGKRESAPDVGIWLSRIENGKWTAPVEVANGIQSPEERFPCWNPVLFNVASFDEAGGPAPLRSRLEAARLWLFYKAGPSPSKWWGMSMSSDDGGKSWSKPARLPDGILGPIKNKPVQLSNGEILSPSSTENAGWRVHFEHSSDGGKTWLASEPVNDGKEFSAIQPSILIHKDGQLEAVGRTRQKSIFQIWSNDNGKTWGPMSALPLPNPNSGIDAVTLKDGRHLLVYNHTKTGRSPLNVAVSADGKEWLAALTLENEPGEFSYPAAIQSADGLVHVVYTWKRTRIKHAVIDPAKLELKPMVNGEWPK